MNGSRCEINRKEIIGSTEISTIRAKLIIDILVEIKMIYGNRYSVLKK